MNIGLDIDGVLASFDRAYAAVLKQETGKDLFHLLPPKTWYWEREGGVTPEEEAKAWKVVKDSLFWATLEPLATCRETLALTNRLRIAHNIYFITSRPGLYAKPLTEAWLVNQGAVMPTVLIVNSDAAKGELASGLKLDVFVDDKPGNCEAVVEATTGLQGDGMIPPSCRVFLVDRPYNETFDHPYVERVVSAYAALQRVLESHGESLRRAA